MSLRVTVLLFARARELAGRPEVRLELPTDATVATALDALTAQSPAVAAVLPSCRTALDEEFAPRTARLHDGATVAVLPPVSGG